MRSHRQALTIFAELGDQADLLGKIEDPRRTIDDEGADRPGRQAGEQPSPAPVAPARAAPGGARTGDGAHSTSTRVGTGPAVGDQQRVGRRPGGDDAERPREAVTDAQTIGSPLGQARVLVGDGGDPKVLVGLAPAWCCGPGTCLGQGIKTGEDADYSRAPRVRRGGCFSKVNRARGPASMLNRRAQRETSRDMNAPPAYTTGCTVPRSRPRTPSWPGAASPRTGVGRRRGDRPTRPRDHPPVGVPAPGCPA